MKAYWRVDEWIHIFLTSALVGGEWSASRPCRFTPGERAPGTHWIGGWVGLRSGLDAVEKRKFLPYRDSNSDPSVIQPVASRYTDCATLAPGMVLVTHKISRIKRVIHYHCDVLGIKIMGGGK
jgi:hypothetical protein